jgi:hypothetical protein
MNKQDVVIASLRVLAKGFKALGNIVTYASFLGKLNLSQK